MNQKIIDKHWEMVLRLGKSGEAIVKTLSPHDAYLLHMGPCLVGEAAELHECVDGAVLSDFADLTNSKEFIGELGDMEFYLVANLNWWGLKRETKSSSWSETERSTTDLTEELLVVGGNYWDVVKRAVVYRKSIDEPDAKYKNATLRDVATQYLRRMEFCLLALEQRFGYTLEQVLEENWKKLADPDKGRYASGSFSDKEAQDRRDETPVNGAQ